MEKGHSALFGQTLGQGLTNFSAFQVHLQDLSVLLFGVRATDRSVLFGGLVFMSLVVVSTASTEAWGLA